MAKKDDIQALLTKYEEDLKAAQAKVGYFEKLFKSDSALPTGRITETALERVEETLADTPAEDVEGVFEVVLDAGISHLDEHYVGLTYIAIQKFLLPMVPTLTAQQAAAFLEKMEAGFPRRYRTPVTLELMKQMKKAAE